MRLPRSVVVVVTLHLLAALAFGALAHIDSTNQFPTLVLNDDGRFAVGLYANRNIGVGLGLLAGLVLRSPLMLLASMLTRLFTDVGDFIMALTVELSVESLAPQIIFFSLLFASEIFVIRRLIAIERTIADG